MEALSLLEDITQQTGLPASVVLQEAGIHPAAQYPWMNGSKPRRSTMRKLKRFAQKVNIQEEPKESMIFPVGIAFVLGMASGIAMMSL